MRVFVPGEGGARELFALAAAAQRAGAPSAAERADARRRVRAGGGRGLSADSRPGLSALRRRAGAAWPRLDGHHGRRPAHAASRKRAFIALLLLSWLPFLVRAVQMYAAANFPQMAFFAPTAETFRQFLDQQDGVRLLRHRVCRRRPHRERPPRQRAADLSVEAADPGRVRLRQVRHSGDLPAAGDVGAGDAAAHRADGVLGQLRVPRGATCIWFRRSRCCRSSRR